MIGVQRQRDVEGVRGQRVRPLAGQGDDLGVDGGNLAAHQRAVLGHDGDFGAGRDLFDGFCAGAGQRQSTQQ